MELIVPEVVVYDAATDTKSVNYDALIPLLIEAIKEQQAQIEALQQQINGGN